MSNTMIKHYVVFMSPGTFFSETTEEEIDSWDVDKAVEMARGIKERYDARPYGFQFATRERGPDDFDSKQTKRSGTYWLGGKIFTAAEILAGTDLAEEILRSNVRINKIKKIIVNTNSWKFTAPFEKDDVFLDVKL